MKVMLPAGSLPMSSAGEAKIRSGAVRMLREVRFATRVAGRCGEKSDKDGGRGIAFMGDV